MIAALIALQLIQAQPAVRPSPSLTVRAQPEHRLVARRQRSVTQARTLLARAEAVRASYAPAAGQPSKAELDQAVEEMKNELDSLSEIGEMESLRLQMAMDRMSKMMSTLSSLLKKISDTQSSIVQNIK